MAPQGETRERILRTASELLQRQGYHGTGLSQVLAESRAPRGSLYFHFPDGKEQLAAESVALETSAASEPIRTACDGAYGDWQRGIAQALRIWGVPDGKAGPPATLVLSSLQGAVMLARVQRDVAAVRTVTRQLGDLIAQAATTAAGEAPRT